MPERMRSFRRQSLVVAGIFLLLLSVAAVGCWRLCTSDNGIAFLTSQPGAEWIVSPWAPDNKVHPAAPQWTVFRGAFRLDAPPAGATLAVRALKSATVVINGQPVPGLNPAGANWKSISTADVSGLIRPGTNDIVVSVTNRLGPPALWLRLQAGGVSLGTDERWQARRMDGEWGNVWRATRPPEIRPGNPLYGGERMPDSVRRVWPALALIGVIALVLVLAANRQIHRWNGTGAAPSRDPGIRLTNHLLAMVIVVRAALFINNLSQLPRMIGFDAGQHEDYIQYIQEKHALPLPEEGWEMHQPPLYYAASALLLDLFNLPADIANDDTTIVLQIENGVIGLVQCWLVLRCMRRLFPGNPAAQAAGLLAGAFLPPNIYLTQYVTNEPLAALLVTAAFYLCLRALTMETGGVRLHAALGLVLGAALLTKLSALLALPVILPALGWRLAARRVRSPRIWLSTVGVVVMCCFIVCGWHYGRVWAHIGRLPLPNWETVPASAWWQPPGYRTAADFVRFGRVLTSPLFSGIHGVPDGFYSTLWGDGMASGVIRLVYRPPWNYDLMNAGYLVAIGISLLFLAGLVVVSVRFLRQPSPEWFLVLGLLSAFSVGIVFMALHGPWLAHLKAFYALPALAPFAALTAAGWDWLGRMHRAWRNLLWVVLLTWVLTTGAAFWIRSNNPETWRSRGNWQTLRQNEAGARESFQQALRLNPDDADARCMLADIYRSQNRTGAAVQQYRQALRIRPDFPEALNLLAAELSGSADPQIRDVNEAVRLAERACELTDYRQLDYVKNLATVYARAGRFDEAVATAEKTCGPEAESSDPEALEKNRPLLATILNNQAWQLATGNDPAARNGARAVQLAQRACELTGNREAVLVGTLAAAWAEAGRFDEAVAAAEKACALAAETGDENLLKRNQALLELYRAHKPYRDAPEKLVPAKE